MMRFSFFALLGSCFALMGCTPRETRPEIVKVSGATATSSPSNEAKGLFEDVAANSGLKFTHDLGDTGKFYFHEFSAPGCAFLDFDGDGDLDVFLVQSGSAERPETVKNRPFCALFRNKGDETFENVTVGSGLDKNLGYAQGVAVADYDNDGFSDLFITAYGGNHLFRNKGGNGKWEDVTQARGLNGVPESSYATSAAWGDYNNDGRLDLYVCYYARWNHAVDKPCVDPKGGERDYCLPQIYKPVTHRLFRNDGARFVDVSQSSGITKAQGRGLAVAFTDYNGDGRQDIFVANDVTPNMLWRNNGDGTFTNTANETGCAYDGQGRTMAAMGIAIGDYNRSGHESLYVSNFSNLPNILFKNNGQFFEDATGPAKLSLLHLRFLSFGCEFLDYDADGWLDLIVNNGHVQARQGSRGAGVLMEQRKQLLQNTGKGAFREITDAAQLGDLNRAVVGRGLATGDFNNDGRVDVLAMAQNAPAQLLKNRSTTLNNWVSFQTIGTKSNRDGLGARLEISTGQTRQKATVRAGSSYLSSSDRRVYFGIGKSKKLNQLLVIWPSGKRETLRDLPANTFYTLTEGRGITARRAGGGKPPKNSEN